jgi:hypothetical protein
VQSRLKNSGTTDGKEWTFYRVEVRGRDGKIVTVTIGDPATVPAIGNFILLPVYLDRNGYLREAPVLGVGLLFTETEGNAPSFGHAPIRTKFALDGEFHGEDMLALLPAFRVVGAGTCLPLGIDPVDALRSALGRDKPALAVPTDFRQGRDDQAAFFSWRHVVSPFGDY